MRRTPHFQGPVAWIVCTGAALAPGCGSNSQSATPHDTGAAGELGAAGSARGGSAGGAGGPTRPGGDAGEAGASGPPRKHDAGANVDVGVPNPCPQPDQALGDRDAAELFGASEIPTFDLYLTPEAWTALQTDAREEQYVPAHACYQGAAIGVVGVRFKGSYGSLYDCYDGGENTCRKLGLKLKFDEYVSGQHPFGLKRLNFQSYRWDDTYLKERLSYDLFRSMGLVAPRSAWALVRVNGDPRGLFGMVEQIDGRFTRDRWPDHGDGNLFKEVWPGQIDDSWILSHLETNEEEGDIAALKAFSAALDAGAGEDLRATLGTYMDLDYLARYMAVDDAIADFDGITTYYTSGAPDQAGNHNFYLYEEAAHKFTLIPWDMESTLSLGSFFGGAPPWQTPNPDCSKTYPVWNGDNQVAAPGCDRVFRALAADLTTYRSETQALLSGPFAEERMLSNIDALAEFIRGEAHADAHGPGAEKFESSVVYLKQQVPQLRRRLMHLQSGESSVPLTVTPLQTTDFESADTYGITDGTTQMCNPNSVASVTLNTSNAMDGEKSLRITFTYRNESAPWNQWSFYTIPLASAPKDLTGLTGIRLKIRSNRARTVRFDIDSPRESAAEKGIRVGWNLDAGPTAIERSVRFADASVQEWAKDPGDDLHSILQATTGLMFSPLCEDRDTDGQLPDGVVDDGWVDIDDITFF